MSITLADMSLRVAKRIATVLAGTATDGTPTSLTDIDNIIEPDGTYNRGCLWFLSGAPDGKVVSLITSHVGNTVYFPSVGTTCAAQVETMTVVGTITGSGNATVVVTAAGMGNSPKTLNVAVLVGDTASVVATKVRAALVADSDVSAFFAISGANQYVVLTALRAAADDTSMNISITNGTCTGLTPAPTSANTRAGIAGVLYALAEESIPFQQFVSGINAALDEVSVTKTDDTLTGDGKTLEFTLPAGVSDVSGVMLYHGGDATNADPDFHHEELNGKLRFDKGCAPASADTLHLEYRLPHDHLTLAADVIDDEVNDIWLEAMAAFNVLMWAKPDYEDEPEFDIDTRLQVVNQKLPSLAKYKHTRIEVHSGGAGPE